MKTGFKHLSVILLCLALVLSITGCKGSDSTDGTDSQSATAYLEAGKNRCVLISVTNNLTEGRERLSDEEMIDWVRRSAETITIEEPESK